VARDRGESSAAFEVRQSEANPYDEPNPSRRGCQRRDWCSAR
jgi:hypothetical protein